MLTNEQVSSLCNAFPDVEIINPQKYDEYVSWTSIPDEITKLIIKQRKEPYMDFGFIFIWSGHGYGYSYELDVTIRRAVRRIYRNVLADLNVKNGKVVLISFIELIIIIYVIDFILHIP